MKILAKVFCFGVADVAQKVIDMGLADNFINGRSEIDRFATQSDTAVVWNRSMIVYLIEEGVDDLDPHVGDSCWTPIEILLEDVAE